MFAVTARSSCSAATPTGMWWSAGSAGSGRGAVAGGGGWGASGRTRGAAQPEAQEGGARRGLPCVSHRRAGARSRMVDRAALIRKAAREHEVRKNAVARLHDEAHADVAPRPRRLVGHFGAQHDGYIPERVPIELGDSAQADASEHFAPDEQVRLQVAPDPDDGARAAAHPVFP